MMIGSGIPGFFPMAVWSIRPYLIRFLPGKQGGQSSGLRLAGLGLWDNPGSPGWGASPWFSSFFLFFFLIIVLAVLLLIAWPLGLRNPLFGIAKWAISLAPPILGIKVRSAGRDAIDRRTSYVFMSNHLSFLDGPLLFLLIPQPVRVILKKVVFRIPVVGQGMRFVGFVPVDRKRVRGGKKSIDRAADLMREQGYSYLIFPEGTRTRDGRTQAFKRGGFFLALEGGAGMGPAP